MSLRSIPILSGRNRCPGFTLIEVLVVVAIIAVLVGILIPSLTKARDQAKRALCTSNLHQQLLAMNSYAGQYRTYLPWRGWFSYTISEVPKEAYGWGGQTTKTRINLAMLIGKHLSRNWDTIYCPSTINTYKIGLKGLNDPNDRFTYGGYNYALPMAARGGADPVTGRSLLACAKLDGLVYPRNINMLDGRWLAVLDKKAKAAGIPSLNGNVDVLRMMPRRLQPIVMDFVAGGGRTDHKGGLNVAYSDGHARFMKMAKNFTEGGGVSNAASFDVWYDMTVQP